MLKRLTYILKEFEQLKLTTDQKAKEQTPHNGSNEEHGLSEIGSPIILTHPVFLFVTCQTVD